ncbi:hypothetical protein AVDCRST_MAG81-5299, partial [uncultured Synechococcales cyanobacterium]
MGLVGLSKGSGLGARLFNSAGKGLGDPGESGLGVEVGVALGKDAGGLGVGVAAGDGEK